MLALTYVPECERQGVYFSPYARIATPFLCDKVGKKK